MVRRTSIRDGKVEKKWERDETTREKQIKGRECLEVKSRRKLAMRSVGAKRNRSTITLTTLRE